ncbi:rhodanese-like domain-containing protein [Pontibacillus salicampi]|uniref:Rhodanese-like domain-containing protein n=1 Tax=Pontibacillus salicampi TaxID=1449801 RepID=A0ABV6LNV1_9BACI
MEVIAITIFVLILVWFIRNVSLPHMYMKKIDQNLISEDKYCVIDVRDYVSAHNSPFPSAENIPLSYLPRVLKDKFDCTKDIVLISDDMRGARIAAKMLRKKQNRSIYYFQS